MTIAEVAEEIADFLDTHVRLQPAMVAEVSPEP
jgi:hypothetical protein